MEKIRFGIVGIGMMGRMHATSLQRNPHAEVVAVCARTESKVKAFQEEFGVPYGYTNVDELVNNPEVDAIVVATGADAHKAPCLAACKAKKHIFCEKPLAKTLEDCEEIEKAVTENGSKCFTVGFMRRFDPDYIKMKKILDSGELGAPLMAHCISRTRSHPKNHTTEQHITNIAIHEIDICRWLLGENLNEVAVRFPRATCFAEGTCQDPQLVLMQSDSGVLIDVEVSGNSYYGYEILCELVCEKGTIRLPVAAEPIVRSYLQCGQAIPEDWTNRFVVAYQEELQYWVDYLQGKTDVPGPGAEDGYEACKISDALIKAQTTGQWEKVEA